MAHALNSPSTLHRRLACPGSANAEKDLPDTTSKYAEEGTKAHEIAAALLLGQTAEIDAEPAEDLLSSVQQYVDTVQATVASLGGHLIVEQQVDYSLYAPAGMDAHGTLDSAVISNDVLVICDYKHGRGVPVFATDNPQLRAYALGVHSLYGLAYDYERVRLEIHQPRIGNHSTEELSVAELERWGHEVLRPGLEATLDPDAVRVAGDHCTFCKARGSCQRLAEFVEETVTAQFDDLTVEPAARRVRRGDGDGAVRRPHRRAGTGHRPHLDRRCAVPARHHRDVDQGRARGRPAEARQRYRHPRLEARRRPPRCPAVDRREDR